MPSSEKTANLALNKWKGTDIPLREDFVADNQILDSTITALQALVAENAGSGSGSGGGTATDPRLDTHMADTTVHLSAADRALLAQAAPVTGNYTGDGQLTKTIVLGFKPRFGFVYAIGQPLVETGANGLYQIVRYGVVGALGDSLGVEGTSTGFKANQLTGSTTGKTYQGMNASGCEYAYALWR